MSECNESCPRRTFCKVAIGGLGVTSAAAVGFPVVSFLGRPVRLSEDKPVQVSLGDLAPGQAEYAELRGQQIIVLEGENGPLVVSAKCPHLGCNVRWEAADSLFRCPCHGAVFDASGHVVSGPVNKDLTSIPFEVKDGTLTVT